MLRGTARDAQRRQYAISRSCLVANRSRTFSEQKKSRKPLYIGLGVLAVLLVAGAVVGGVLGSRAARNSSASAASSGESGAGGTGTPTTGGTGGGSGTVSGGNTAGSANGALRPTVSPFLCSLSSTDAHSSSPTGYRCERQSSLPHLDWLSLYHRPQIRLQRRSFVRSRPLRFPLSSLPRRSTRPPSSLRSRLQVGLSPETHRRRQLHGELERDDFPKRFSNGRHAARRLHARRRPRWIRCTRQRSRDPSEAQALGIRLEIIERHEMG